ncbi:MAG: hypothetical protein HXY44_01745 [Syntrophaceae bacterium]|nr:hypothetical protein [Syntrophaceae bacterium]
MRTIWIGTIALTFVLGTGMVALMYIMGKMIFSYSQKKSMDPCRKLTYPALIEA